MSLAVQTSSRRSHESPALLVGRCEPADLQLFPCQDLFPMSEAPRTIPGRDPQEIILFHGHYGVFRVRVWPVLLQSSFYNLRPSCPDHEGVIRNHRCNGCNWALIYAQRRVKTDRGTRVLVVVASRT
jgi:hypothetical protein